MTGADLLAVLRAHVADLHWRDVLLVRDVVDAELNVTVNRKQAQDLPGDGRAPRALRRPAAKPEQEPA